MLFVTTGTCKSFHRLIKHLDEISPQLNEKIIAQIGHSQYIPQNMMFERFYPSLQEFIDESRLVISHGGFSAVEIIKSGKPCILVPRQKKFDEHFDNHQVEFAELLHIKCGVPFFVNIEELTADIIKGYNDLPKYNSENLALFKNKIKEIIK